jgi:DNA-binding NtrC family response regulator
MSPIDGPTVDGDAVALPVGGFMKPATILVVDDESLIRWSIKTRLMEAGFQVKEAETAAEALSAAREGVDLVLLDYRLPDADGLSVLKRIKETDPDTVVLMLTGHGSVGIAVEAMKQGAFHYVAKPFDLDELTVLVEKRLAFGARSRRFAPRAPNRTRSIGSLANRPRCSN